MEKERVTIQDLASIIGTSPGTISRALNDKDGVGEELRARIKAVAKEMGYTPRRQHPKEVMLVFPLAGVGLGPYTSGLAVIQESLARQNCVAINGYERDPKSQVLIMESRNLAAAIYFCCNPNEEVIQVADKVALPLVLIHRESPLPHISSFVSDDFHGGYIATTHLLEQGRHRVAFLGPRKDYSPRLRWLGYCKAMEEQGATPIYYDPSYLNRPQELIRDLQARGVNGIFTWDDDTAERLMSVLLYHSIQIPKDIAVVGYNAMPPKEDGQLPALTSVYWPIDQVCQWAMDYIAQCLVPKEGLCPIKVKLTPRLIVRSSSVTT